MAEKNILQKLFNPSARGKTRWIFVLILIIVIAAGLVVGGGYYNKAAEKLAAKTGEVVKLPQMKKIDFRLGLDLLGGTRLVYETDMSIIDDKDEAEAAEGARDVIERRVNVFGVSEPVVQTNRSGGDYQIIVEIAGIKDINEAIRMIGETPLLEFKEQNTEAKKLTDEENKQLEEFNKNAELKAAEILGKVISGGDFSALAKEFSEDPGSKDNGGDLDWFGRGAMVPEFEAAVFDRLKKGEVEKDLVKTQFGYHIIKKTDEREIEGNIEVRASHILIKTKTAEDIAGPQDEWKNTELSGKYLKKASVQFSSQDNSPQVSLEFDDEGSKLFEEITARNVSKPVAIFLDNYPISIPTVNEKITGGKAVISGDFNIKEAKLLAQRLNAGALPVPISLVNQQNIGASLGQDSLVASLKAGLYAFLLVVVFMVLFYRFPGLLAIFSLMIYSLLVLTIFKLWPVTLTLSGIAGFIMSIGMAVDANILIFARLREELSKGRPLGMALEEAFQRAWPSIRDSNLFTVITCVILIAFTTSAVKGFAVTLIIGVAMSMFSAIIITRNFLRLIPTEWLEKKKWLIGRK